MDTSLDDIFNNANQNITEIKELDDDSFTLLVASSMLAKSTVPYSHRRIANNFVVLRRICKFQIVQPRISNVEIALLAKYAFSTLENTSISRSNSEIKLLKDWSTSTDDTLREDANEILKIRVKELKFILSDNYVAKSNEMLKGYKAYETYFTNITKYYA